MERLLSMPYLPSLDGSLERRPIGSGCARPSVERGFRDRRDAGRQLARALAANPENAVVTLSIDATKADLEKAPLIKGDNYATLPAPGFADEVRHYFGAIGRRAAIGAEQDRH
jgi:hypothetical protein